MTWVDFGWCGMLVILFVILGILATAARKPIT